MFQSQESFIAIHITQCNLYEHKNSFSSCKRRSLLDVSVGTHNRCPDQALLRCVVVHCHQCGQCGQCRDTRHTPADTPVINDLRRVIESELYTWSVIATLDTLNNKKLDLISWLGEYQSSSVACIIQHNSNTPDVTETLNCFHDFNHTNYETYISVITRKSNKLNSDLIVINTFKNGGLQISVQGKTKFIKKIVCFK